MSEEKQNVVILQDPLENERPRRWTMRRYLKGIVFGKWWILGFSVVGAVAGYLGTRFLLNNMRESVSSTFSYQNIALTSDGRGGGTFVDGTRFDYASLVSLATLNEVKNSDTKYGAIDLAALSNSISISIESYEDPQTNATVYVTPNKFTITAKLAPFKDQALARSFVGDIIETVNVKAQAAVNQHEINTSLPESFSVLSFADQISLLATQRATIRSEIDALVTTFTANGVVDASGTLLRTVSTNFEYAFDYLGIDYFDYLKDSLDVNFWVNYTPETLATVISRYTETADGYKERMRQDIITAKTKQAKIDELVASSGGIVISDSQYADLIASYTKDIVDIELRRNDYIKELKDMGYDTETFKNDPTEANLATIVLLPGQGTLSRLLSIQAGTADEETKKWAEGCAEFRKSIEEVRNNLSGEEGHAEVVNKSYRYLYNTQRANVTYYNANTIVVGGSIPNALGAVAGLVVFFLVSSLILAAVYINRIDPIIDLPKKKEEEATK